MMTCIGISGGQSVHWNPSLQPLWSSLSAALHPAQNKYTIQSGSVLLPVSPPPKKFPQPDTLNFVFSVYNANVLWGKDNKHLTVGPFPKKLHFLYNQSGCRGERLDERWNSEGVCVCVCVFQALSSIKVFLFKNKIPSKTNILFLTCSTILYCDFKWPTNTNMWIFVHLNNIS